MKYKIDGIDKSQIISSIRKVGNDYILVNYLDGTQDAVEYSKESINSIMKLMNIQAKIYVEKEKKIVLKSTMFQIINVSIATIISFLAGYNMFQQSTLLNGYSFLIIGSIIYAAATLKLSQDKINDVKKYDLFLTEVRAKLDEYQNILSKEKSLTKERKNQILFQHSIESPALEDITHLDNASLNDLKYISTKVDRYQEITGKQKTKMKENTSDY